METMLKHNDMITIGGRKFRFQAPIKALVDTEVCMALLFYFVIHCELLTCSYVPRDLSMIFAAVSYICI